ncbi:MAG: PepSY domain-containing protein [Armatimonadetes bacterium]|nr:PepSY domain-containing protein [Armatimonadota bacterium]
MYHFIRTGHRWVGIIAALFLATIAVTGFLLATKDTFGWVKPPTHALADVVSLDRAASAAFALNIPELKTRWARTRSREGGRFWSRAAIGWKRSAPVHRLPNQRKISTKLTRLQSERIASARLPNGTVWRS